jgi:hypothetical protein
VPFIPRQYTDCAVYLYPTVQAAEDGLEAGGSGFLIDMPSDKHPEIRHIYAVTNAHVVDSTAPVIRLNTETGEHQSIPLEVRNWIFPEADTVDGVCDDLAIALLRLPSGKYQTYPIPIEKTVTRNMVERNLIGAGDDVFMVGRFRGHDGKERNTPAIRFGNIAMLPHELVSQLPARKHDQESYIVEMRSISGFSGAPVFVYDSADALPNWARDEAGYGTKLLALEDSNPFLFLLGINWGHLQAKEYLVHSSMAGVVPGWQLLDLLDSEEARIQRKERDQEIQQSFS